MRSSRLGLRRRFGLRRFGCHFRFHLGRYGCGRGWGRGLHRGRRGGQNRFGRRGQPSPGLRAWPCYCLGRLRLRLPSLSLDLRSWGWLSGPVLNRGRSNDHRSRRLRGAAAWGCGVGFGSAGLATTFGSTLGVVAGAELGSGSSPGPARRPKQVWPERRRCRRCRLRRGCCLGLRLRLRQFGIIGRRLP